MERNTFFLPFLLSFTRYARSIRSPEVIPMLSVPSSLSPLPSLSRNPRQKAVYSARAFNNIVYKTVDGIHLRLNLFLPELNGKPRLNAPLLINVDAGRWSSGKPGRGGYWRHFQAIERGFAVASVAHRTAIHTPFPGPIEDIKAAIRFLRANAGEFGLDKNRVAIMGYSSGAQIACMAGIPDNVRIFDVGDHLEESSHVQAVVNFFGPVDMHYFVQNYNRCIDCVYYVLNAPLQEDGRPSRELTPELLELAKRCSAPTYVNKDFAPTILFYGVKDRFVPLSQGARLYEALYQAGVRTELYVANKGVHCVPSHGKIDDLAGKIYNFLDWE